MIYAQPDMNQFSVFPFGRLTVLSIYSSVTPRCVPMKPLFLIAVSPSRQEAIHHVPKRVKRHNKAEKKNTCRRWLRLAMFERARTATVYWQADTPNYGFRIIKSCFFCECTFLEYVAVLGFLDGETNIFLDAPHLKFRSFYQQDAWYRTGCISPDLSLLWCAKWASRATKYCRRSFISCRL